MLTPKNALLVLLSLGLATTGGLAWWQQQEIDRLRTAARAAVALGTGDHREGKALPEGRPGPETAELPGAGESEASGTAVPPPPNSNRREAFTRAMRAVTQTPEYQNAAQVLTRGNVEARYAALFGKLHLSPEQLEKFKALLAERREAEKDAREIAREQGLIGPANREKLRSLVATAQAEVDGSIRSAIGEEAFAQYQYYEQTQPQRSLVSQLETRLSYTTTPLTPVQREQLVALLHATTASNPSAPLDGPGGPPPGSRVAVTEQVLQQAPTVLSVEQMAALQQLKTEQEAQAQLERLYRKAWQNGAPPPPP